MQQKETTNKTPHPQQYSSCQQQLPQPSEPNQPYPLKIENEPSNQNIKAVFSKWQAQFANQNISISDRPHDQAELSLSRSKMMYRLPPFNVEYISREKISKSSESSRVVIKQQSNQDEPSYLSVSQTNRRKQIQGLKIQNGILLQERGQKQVNLRFYTGYADCKDECSEEEYIPERQMVIIEQQLGNQRKKRKYVQRKMWKGICSILDRKYHFNPSVSEYFDEEQLENPSFTSDECKLWKNLMNKYVMEIKHRKGLRQKSKDDSIKDQDQLQFIPVKKKTSNHKKSKSGSKTETLLQRFNYVPPFMPNMMQNMGNYPLIFPQAFKMMDEKITLKVEQIEEIKHQISSIIFPSPNSNKIESNEEQIIANFIRGFSAHIFSPSGSAINKQSSAFEGQNEVSPFFLEHLSFQKKVLFLKKVEASIKNIKDKGNMVDLMIDNCTQIYCQLLQQDSNQQGIKNYFPENLIKEEEVEDKEHHL